MGRLLTLLRKKGGFLPTDLEGLALWLDASDLSTQTVSSTGAYIAAEGGGLVLPGTTNNYASTPDSAALDVVGDIDVRVFLADAEAVLANTTKYIVSKGAVGQFAYNLVTSTSSQLRFWASSDGSTIDYDATVSFAAVPSGALWLRATRSASSGDIKFYYSADGASWTQVGATQSSAAGAIFGSTTAVYVGANSASGGNAVLGTVYRAQVLDGIDGTLVFDADFTTQTPYTTSFTESALGATVTINSTTSGAASVSQWDDKSGNATHFVQGTGANQPSIGTANTLNGLNTVDFVIGTTTYLQTAAAVSLSQPFTFFIAHKGQGTSDNTLSDGFDSTSRTLPFFESSGNYLYQAGTGVDSGISGIDGPVVGVVTMNGASSAVRVNGSAGVNGNPGGNPWRIGTLGAAFNGGAGSGAAIGEILTYNRALSAEEIASVESYLAAKWGVTLFDANNPATYPGLELWLDASDETTITESGGLVSQWDDKSGNARHVTQGTALNQPTTGTRTLNGLNVLDFDGANDTLATASSVPISQPNTIIVVGEVDVLGDSYVIDARDMANSSQRQIVGFLSTPRFRLFASTSLDQGTPSAVTPYVLTGVMNGASSELYANGSSVVSGNVGPNGLDLIRVGSDRAGGLPFNGKIAEVLVLSGALSAEQRAAIEAYLATKWGVTLA